MHDKPFSIASYRGQGVIYGLVLLLQIYLLLSLPNVSLLWLRAN